MQGFRAAIAALPSALALLPLRILGWFQPGRGRTRSRVAYGDLPRQSLDIYTPLDARADTPVVLFFHGGGWSSGSASAYRFVGEALAAGGVIAAVANYRLYPEVVFPDFVRDGARAVAEIARRFPGRALVVAGHSAGAYIALLLALDRRYLAAAGVPAGAVAGAVGISGPYDFLPLTRPRYRRVFPQACLADSQPIRFAGGHAAPVLLLTGDRDRTVDPANTMRLAAAIRAKGGKVTVKVYPGAGHMATVLAFARILPWRKPPVRRDILAFVRNVARDTPVTAA
jgi:acetyl esterase/lipase